MSFKRQARRLREMLWRKAAAVNGAAGDRPFGSCEMPRGRALIS
ncbi:hypothetical protein I546_2413 [Mycobacterium kansasii 732]|nr:hypothetical protein I546_2413 [Mycobacterium kansasii 732]